MQITKVRMGTPLVGLGAIASRMDEVGLDIGFCRVFPTSLELSVPRFPRLGELPMKSPCFCRGGER